MSKQRLPVRNAALLETPSEMNQGWSFYFMHDALVCSKRSRAFNLVNDFNREALGVIDLFIAALSVVRVLELLVNGGKLRVSA
ncbi:MAG: hypothetical protein E6856_18745 [Klebsiella michiganensis]|nr:hypothetical protein [Klebsiella michiganensis]MDU1617559.1 hypothetical protein [Klebsiella michiganensis]